MTYKTLLVHFNDKRRAKLLLAPALELGEAFQAHVIGLSVVPPVVVIATGAPEAAPVVIEEHVKLYREENLVLKAQFDEAMRGRAFPYEWRDDEAGPFAVADRVLESARTADLVIAAQTDPQWPASDLLDVADRLAVESGRPVLIIPNAWAPKRVGRRVLVAWNNRREAARAAFDALPILVGAKEVKVVWVNPQSEQEAAQDVPAADICTALARHSVKCQAREERGPRRSVGETLLEAAQEMGADLLVMGCYGRARLREFIFGGASRHVLANMTLPVLMSH
jgi:nucleotide-binding universal stress UspA family protein